MRECWQWEGGQSDCACLREETIWHSARPGTDAPVSLPNEPQTRKLGQDTLKCAPAEDEEVDGGETFLIPTPEDC